MIQTLDRIRQKATDAKQAALELAIKVVDGDKVDDSEIDVARQAADLTAAQFAGLVSKLAKRKEAADTLDAFDESALREANLAERRKLTAEIEATSAEAEKIRTSLSLLTERMESNLAAGRGLTNEAQQRHSDYEKALRETGGGDDWRKITL